MTASNSLNRPWPPEKMETKGAEMLRVAPFQFLEALFPSHRGWRATNTAVESGDVINKEPMACIGFVVSMCESGACCFVVAQDRFDEDEVAATRAGGHSRGS